MVAHYVKLIVAMQLIAANIKFLVFIIPFSFNESLIISSIVVSSKLYKYERRFISFLIELVNVFKLHIPFGMDEMIKLKSTTSSITKSNLSFFFTENRAKF